MLKKSDVFFISLFSLVAGHSLQADHSGQVVRLITEENCLRQLANIGAKVERLRPLVEVPAPSTKNKRIASFSSSTVNR